MNRWKKINLEPFDEDTTEYNLSVIHRVSEELIDTGKIPIRNEPRRLKHAAVTRTNSYIRTTPGVTMWINTPEIGQDARVIDIWESENVGWMVVHCFTAMQEYHLEVTANWPLITRLQWP